MSTVTASTSAIATICLPGDPTARVHSSASVATAAAGNVKDQNPSENRSAR